VHLSVEVIGKSSVVVQSAEIGTAHVAYLQLLVARGARGVGQVLQFSLAFVFPLRGLSHAEELVVGTRYFIHLAEDLDLDKAVVDGGGEVGNRFELYGGKGG